VESLIAVSTPLRTPSAYPMQTAGDRYVFQPVVCLPGAGVV
jgi:hypothetical protein